MSEMQSLKYKVGDHLLHCGSGVCVVKEIGVPNAHHIDRTKLYYFLAPIYDPDSVIYAPIETVHQNDRALMSKDEAEELLCAVETVSPMLITDEKTRESLFQETLRSNDCRAMIKLVKALYLRKAKKVTEKKNFAQMDEKYLRIAEDLVSKELSTVLFLSCEQVSAYIDSHMQDAYQSVCSV